MPNKKPDVSEKKLPQVKCQTQSKRYPSPLETSKDGVASQTSPLAGRKPSGQKHKTTKSGPNGNIRFVLMLITKSCFSCVFVSCKTYVCNILIHIDPIKFLYLMAFYVQQKCAWFE